MKLKFQMKKASSIFMTLWILLSIWNVGLRANAQPGPILSVEPQSTIDPSLEPSSGFSISINVANVANLYGVEFKLSFDPNVLLALGVTAGSFWTGGVAEWINTIDPSGFAWYSVTRPLGETQGLSGNGTIATIDFMVLALGHSQLVLYDVLMGDPFANPIYPIVFNGYFSNVGVPPVALFAYSPSTPSVNDNVLFDASASYDPDGTIVLYTWEFGDGTNASESAPMIYHTYSVNGTYTVTLTVQDNNGLIDIESHLITVLPPPQPSVYTRRYLPSQWISDGAAMGWHADDNSWAYTLPFDFPFYGTYYRTIYISSNSLITFRGPDPAFWNSIGELANRYAITPAWDDWLTYFPNDIYIWQPDSNHVIIRWDARHISSGAAGNFEAILGQDGVIQFNYGYNDGSISSTVGISNGAGEILAEDIFTSNYINSILFTPYRPEHDVGVRLEGPANLVPNQSAALDATVYNFGMSNEISVELQLLLNNSIVDSIVIPELLSDSSYRLSYLWTPTLEGNFNITAYAAPVPNEADIMNNQVTIFATVANPLIQPLAGQWANYTITTPYGRQLLNATYSHYITPLQMYVTLWLKDPYGNSWTNWLTLNILNRRVESGMWSGYWYPLWIQTDVTIGSTVGILDRTGTVAESRFIEVGEYLVESWGLQVQYYDWLYTFWFDKVNGLVVAAEGMSPYYNYTDRWQLTATNVPLVYLPRLRIQTSPESGPVGTAVTVTGVNAMPNATVEIYYDETYMGPATADIDGSFVFTLAVPSTTRGIYTIRAVDITTNISDSKVFTVLSSISVTPLSGPMGSTVQVSGLGFGAYEEVVVCFEDMQIGKVYADASGSFTATFSIPLSQSGSHLIKAWYNTEYVQTTFTITDVEPLDVQIDAGTIYFKGETAEFYVLTPFKGKPIDVTVMNATLYMPDGTTRTLTYQRIATGLYRVRYTISGKGGMTGTYTLFVEAGAITNTVKAYGTSIKTFLVKPTWEKEAPKIAALSLASVGLVAAMVMLWRKEKKQLL